MITIVARSGYDGRVYRIDALDRDMAEKWLYAIARKFGPDQGGVYAPLQVTQCSEWTP